MRAMIDIPEMTDEKGVDQKYIQEAVAALLYYNGKLSEKQACQMIGSTRRNFEDVIIPQFGLSMIGGTQEDRDFEVNSNL